MFTVFSSDVSFSPSFQRNDVTLCYPVQLILIVERRRATTVHSVSARAYKQVRVRVDIIQGQQEN
jgi:hypothetical protein